MNFKFLFSALTASSTLLIGPISPIAYADGLLPAQAQGEYSHQVSLKSDSRVDKYCADANIPNGMNPSSEKALRKCHIIKERKTYSSGWVEFGFFESLLNEAQMAIADANPLKFDMTFTGLSADGSLLKTEFRVSYPLFPQILVDHSPTFIVRQKWKLESCDNEPIRISPMEAGNLQGAIAGLRATEFKEYFNCDLEPTDYAACLIEGVGCESKFQGAHLTFHNNGSIIIRDIRDGSLQGAWIPNRAPDSASEAKVNQATQQFVNLLKDYGNLLVGLNGAPKESGNRDLALKAYLSQNRNLILQSLATIEQNLSGTSAITKLVVTTSINRAYAYVHLIEGQVQNQYALDEIIHH